jgi:hypothetical protein
MDPLAEAAPRILAHMNADHADALVLYCRAFAGVEARAAVMTAVDCRGFEVRALVDGGARQVRIDFPRQVLNAGDARTVLVEMVRRARGGVEG